MSYGTPPANKEPSKPNRPSLREIGPAWITAIAALIASLTGVGGFFLGQRSVEGGSQASSQTTKPASGQPSSQEPIITPYKTDAPATGLGSVLASQTPITLSSTYGITFGSAPLQPQEGKGDLGFNFNYGNELDFEDGQFSRLEGSPPTYHACATDQLYVPAGTSNYSTGMIYCFVGHGVVAAFTITGYDTDSSAAPTYVKFNIIVWKNS